MKKALLILLLISIFLPIPVLAAETNQHALEEVLITGDLSTGKLLITGNGEVFGDDARINLFGKSENLLVSNLKVNGNPISVSFDASTYYFNLKKGKFVFAADLTLRKGGSADLFAIGPINLLKFELKNGYAVGGDRYGLLEDTIVLQSGETQVMRTDGFFEFTYGEQNSFYYDIQFDAIGTSLGRYELSLFNAEEITSVEGASGWSIENGRLLLDMSSGSARVGISGFFYTLKLVLPLGSGKHQVSIASDNERKLSIVTTAKEIDPSEGRVSTGSNGRLFLASQEDTFSVNVKNLALLPSLIATVNRAENLFAINDRGEMLGETSYQYANSGLDYLALNLSGVPLYASTANSAIKLTGEEEQLLLAFPREKSGNFEITFFNSGKSLGLLNLVEVPIPLSGLPITTETTSIYLPKDRIVLNTFGAEGGSELPKLKTIVLFVVIVGAVACIFFKNRKFIVSYIVFGTGLFCFDSRVFMVFLALTLAIIAKRYISLKSKKSMIFAGLVLVCVFIVALSLSGAISSISRGIGVDRGVFVFEGQRMNVVEESWAGGETQEMMSAKTQFVSMGGLGFGGMKKLVSSAGETTITVPAKEGVYPVKFKLPAFGKRVTVTNNMVTSENPTRIRLILITAWVKYVIYVIALIAGFIGYGVYKTGHKEEKKKHLNMPNT